MPTVNRRRFITGGSASLALAAVEQGRAEPLGIPIGLQLYTVYSELEKDFEGTLSRIAAFGIREIELLDFPDRKPRDVRRALDNAGLRPISIHLGGDDLRILGGGLPLLRQRPARLALDLALDRGIRRGGVRTLRARLPQRKGRVSWHRGRLGRLRLTARR